MFLLLIIIYFVMFVLPDVYDYLFEKLLNF